MLSLIFSVLFAHDDPGGNSYQYRMRMKEYDRIVISGQCASSCVLYMTHENVCAMPGTLLGMHYGKRAGKWSKDATDLFLTRLPENVQSVWAEPKLKKGDKTEDFIWIKARDVMPICKTKETPK